MIYDCIIIGAGASGLMCAASMNKINKDRPGFSGLILEKTSRAGTKLLMSGSGQCNITHSGSVKEFVSRYGENGRKIRTCLYKHSNLELISRLEKNGIKTVTREDGKVFPASMKAGEIQEMLIKKSRENGFRILYDSQVRGIKRYCPDAADSRINKLPADVLTSSGNHLWHITAEGSTFLTRALIIAAGGCSYPSTGSDGSIFGILRRDLQLRITALRPALSPVRVCEYPYGDLSGISFENAGITIMRDDKLIIRRNDALLLTHNDLSGPVILNTSKYMLPEDRLIVNYLYPMNYETVLSELKSILSDNGKDASNIISDAFGLPKRFCRMITGRYGHSPKKLAHALTGEEFTVNQVAGFGKAMVTAGGIALSEIDTSTMQLRKHPGIFAIGEVCDVDGETGGYNLQFAYSSAKAAAKAVSGLLSSF